MPCPRCNGTGWVYMVALHDQPCPLCRPRTPAEPQPREEQRQGDDNAPDHRTTARRNTLEES